MICLTVNYKFALFYFIMLVWVSTVIMAHIMKLPSNYIEEISIKSDTKKMKVYQISKSFC